MINEVHEAYSNIERPSGDENILIIREKRSGEPLCGLNHRQQLLLAKMLSKDGREYALLSLQRAYDEVRNSPSFRREVEDRWICSREVLLSSGHVIERPEVEISAGEIVYTGEKTPLKLYNDDVLKTLSEKKLFCGDSMDVYSGSIYFFGKEEASPHSRRMPTSRGRKLFSVVAVPLMENKNCLTVLEC